MPSRFLQTAARYLVINRTVGVVLVAVLFFGLGEELWSPFFPNYLKALSDPNEKALASTAGVLALWTVGIYACLRNLFEGFCYIGGGQLTARLGDRGSLLLFGLLTISGYVLFLIEPAPWAAIVAALLILGWEPLSVPATFTTVGATVDRSKQGMAFAVQSIQKRLPKVVGPALAGLILGLAVLWHGQEEGTVRGMRWLVAGALCLGLCSLAIQLRWMPHRKVPPAGPSSLEIFRQLHPTLRRLLIAEIFTRWCDWLFREFVTLYLFVVRGASYETIGWLLALQNLTALLTYLPIGRLTQRAGLQPFIGVTFIFFALFPLSLALVPDDLLALAFIVYGLREVGEPARKALITSLFPEEVRARGVGLYWGLRCFAVCTASVAGAGIWIWLGADNLLSIAFGLGCVGAAVFYLFCRQPAAPEPRTG